MPDQYPETLKINEFYSSYFLLDLNRTGPLSSSFSPLFFLFLATCDTGSLSLRQTQTQTHYKGHLEGGAALFFSPELFSGFSYTSPILFLEFRIKKRRKGKEKRRKKEKENGPWKDKRVGKSDHTHRPSQLRPHHFLNPAGQASWPR